MKVPHAGPFFYQALELMEIQISKQVDLSICNKSFRNLFIVVYFNAKTTDTSNFNLILRKSTVDSSSFAWSLIIVFALIFSYGEKNLSSGSEMVMASPIFSSIASARYLAFSLAALTACIFSCFLSSVILLLAVLVIKKFSVALSSRIFTRSSICLLVFN